MFDIECPWCAGPATVEVAERDEFECAGCAIRVEIVADPPTTRSPAPPDGRDSSGTSDACAHRGDRREDAG